MKNVTYGFILASAMLLSTGAALADASPTLDQVYQAAHSGHMEDAERMMDKVLKEHPDSAKAHFIEAELLARQGQMARAGDELKNAERLKPGLAFATPQAVNELRNWITSAYSSAAPAVSYQAEPRKDESNKGAFWGVLMFVIVIIALIAMIVMVLRAAFARKEVVVSHDYQRGSQGGYSPSQPYSPYGGGFNGGGMAPSGGGIGSGIMGGLATGAAVGVGVVAGEALAHHFMDGGSGSNVAPVADYRDNSSSNSSDNMGGTDFGIADNSSWDGSSSSSSSDSSSSSSDSGGSWD